MPVQTEATIEDLYRVREKAELVNGEIVRLMSTGEMPGYAGDEIFASLREYAKRTGRGRAVGDNKAFIVNLPHRKSFSPDAAFHFGQLTGMKFYEGAPVFAVEVRSREDYGPRAERELAQKHADYFAAGTLVVWDVDLLGKDIIRKYHVSSPGEPEVSRRDDVANAEPAVPGWVLKVNDLFD